MPFPFSVGALSFGSLLLHSGFGVVAFLTLSVPLCVRWVVLVKGSLGSFHSKSFLLDSLFHPL